MSSYLNKNNSTLKLNYLCPYFTMFPLEFPFQILSNTSQRGWVLDPFCGRGTTIYAARLHGLPAIGIDSNLVACAISQAKLAHANANDVITMCENILHSEELHPKIPDSEFWRLSFHPKTLHNICILREHFLTHDQFTDSELILRALLLGILHGPRNKYAAPTYLSNQMPRTYATKPGAAVTYWEKHNLQPAKIDLLDCVRRRAQYILSSLPPKTSGFVVHADSRKLSLPQNNIKFSTIITSPPYYGMRTYLPDQWLRNWFIGGPPSVDYDTSGQLSNGNEESFVESLSTVWNRISEFAMPKARLVIRFGALPSTDIDPLTLLKKSFERSASPWKILTVKDAGTAYKGKRQADQFNRKTGVAIREVDLYARMEC